jgi:mRNA interferase MazF
VLAGAGRGDWILCQVTSNPYGDPIAIELTPANFDSGSLHQQSYARPAKLFTANESLVAKSVGRLTRQKAILVRDAVIQILTTRN